jgi:hypothetical protein
MGDSRPRERVLANQKYEVMTSTQACRFKHLERIRFRERKSAENNAGDLPYYPLSEAARRLSTGAERLLLMAAAGKLDCYVSTDGLRGEWRLDGNQANAHLKTPRDLPETGALALQVTECRDIEAYGSVNVSEFELRLPNGVRATFCLNEPLWVDPERLLLKHPLPAMNDE